MKSWLKPGTEVVCIRDRPWRHLETGDGTTGPVENEICVVTDVDEEDAPTLYVGLVGYGDALFDATNFRPLQKRSTDAQVSKLKRLLNTTPADLEKVDG